MKQVTLSLTGLILLIYSVSAQIPEKAEDISPLLIGEIIPDVTLKAADATGHSTLEIISEKPAVILFYRGGWCPYCNAHLADIQGAESEIINLGFQIIAISPDSPENLQATDEKNQLSYRLYSDSYGTLMKAMGIAFRARERSFQKLMRYSAGLNKSLLPVPSVFVVDTSGIIEFEYINPNYRTRLGSDFLLAVLRELKKRET